MNNTQNLEIFKIIGEVLYNFWWVIFPVTFYYVFKIIHFDYVAFYSANSFYNKLEWVLLEVIPSRDIERSPKIMESILQGISGVTASTNVFEVWLDGKYTQDRFGLELVGEEGKIHFYVRAYKKYRNLIEANIYAQYPDAEIIEAEDYTKRFPKIIPNKYWDLWGADFEFTAPAPYPIKTYDKFDETVTGETIDPVSSMAEAIGSLGPNQHIWLQYNIEPLQEKWNLEEAQRKIIKKLKGTESAESMGLSNHLVDVFKNIFNGIWRKVEFAISEKKEQQPLEFRLSPVEKEILKSVEENLGRYTYKVKMRFIYLGHRKNFERAYVSTFIGALKQFNDINYNQFKPTELSKTYGKIFLKERTSSFRKRKIYERYKKRNMDGSLIYLSSKELATIFHLPDMNVKSPAIAHVASKLGSAPPNLPIM